MSRDALVLLVEDQPAMRETLRRMLEDDVRVLEAKSAEEALERAHGLRVDVAVIDLVLPGEDGFSLLAKMRKRPEQTDVIVITGDAYDADEKLARALRGEAFYFLTKPFERIALRTLVARCLHLRSLQSDLKRRNAELERDFRLAREFQSQLLPPRRQRAGAAHLAALHRPCDDLGGDFFDVRETADGLVFLVADVVGHGVTAAMLAGMLATTWARAVREGGDLEEIHLRLWEMVQEWDDDRYLTCFLGHVDREFSRLRWIAAGHPPALVLGVQGSAEELAVEAPMISPAFPWLATTPNERPLAAGDRVLVLTDGLPETRNTAGELFGWERVAEAIAAAPAEQALERLFEMAEAHRARRPREDDLTALLLWRDEG
ncbi:MAG: fused response regulator/phosphatase [Planctomycetes bacterium]|nr:fused response regulator/phosphatase [Planctomycetota bacterium]